MIPVSLPIPVSPPMLPFLLFPAEGPGILGFRVQDASVSIIYEIFQFRNTFHAEDSRKILGKSRKRRHHRASRRDVSAKAPGSAQPIFHLRRKPNENHFRPGLRIAKIPVPVRFGSTDATGASMLLAAPPSCGYPLYGKRRDVRPSFQASQTSFAVFIRTPGPMVAAATQLRIYWPLAAAGLAFTMAPIRVL